MKFKRYEEDTFAVLAVLYSPTYILLIKNLRGEPVWKFVGESSKTGELPLDTLVRGLWEESGLCIRAIRDAIGVIEEIGDDSMTVKKVREPVRIFKKHPYWHHFYKVRMLHDSHLLDLSGKQFPGGDTDEFFETKAFPVMEPLHMKDFFPRHVSLFNEFLRAA